jgi:hypothetical protein
MGKTREAIEKAYTILISSKNRMEKTGAAVNLRNLGEAVEVEKGVYEMQETAEIGVLKKDDDSRSFDPGHRSLVYVAGTKTVDGERFLVFSSNINDSGDYGTMRGYLCPLEELCSYECTPLHREKTY